MGGRISLKLVERFPERIESIFLFAADGIKTALSYRITILPLSIKHKVIKWVGDGNQLTSLAKGLYKIRLLKKSTMRFVEYFFEKPELRKQTFAIWILLHPFYLNKAKLFREINKKKIPLIAFFGKHDKLIPLENAKHLQKKVFHANISIVPLGHELLKEKLNPTISEILQRHFTK